MGRSASVKKRWRVRYDGVWIDPENHKTLLKSVACLKLRRVVTRRLREDGLRRLGDLVQATVGDLSKILSPKELREVRRALAKEKLAISMRSMRIFRAIILLYNGARLDCKLKRRHS